MTVEVLYSEAADQALAQMEATIRDDYQRVADALADFVADPGADVWRRRRYKNPPVFGFTVRTPAAEYLVLWSRIDDTAIVEYVGPDI